MKVVLKLLQGMQELQKQIVVGKEEAKSDEVEYVRFSADLPRLPEWSSESAPIEFADCCDGGAQGEEMVSFGTEIIGILLMAALPESLKEEVISSKSVTTLCILTKAMIQYQPGGLSERSAILSALESPQESPTIASAVTQLRKWIRWKRRAQEVGVAIPDSSILIRGLGKLMRKITVTYPDLSFRLSLVRNSLLVDTVPTLETVSQYSEHVLAELEQLGCQGRKREPMAEQPKVKRLEETSKPDDKLRPKGKPQEELEAKKKPCRFFLADQGCRRGRGCPFGHVLDLEKRCWTCGGKSHVSTQCPTLEDQKPKAAKMAKTGKDPKTAASSSEKVEESSEVESVGEDSMKLLLDEASKVLKSMNEGDANVKEKRQNIKDPDQKIQGLQRQLDELRKATMRPFRISKLSPSASKGLLDSGATHPLRAKRQGERLEHLPKVKVTLAGDKEIYMALTPTGVIVGGEGTEPIVPMGLLTTVLGCEITWKESALQVVHPVRGCLDVVIESGCPVISQVTALDLVEEIEAKAKKLVKTLNVEGEGEVKWLERLVAEHPAFQGVPEEIKTRLVETPADNVVPLGNRRRRKLWKTKGMMVHLFSGEDAGYTLGRAFHEIGGDKRLMLELDVQHQKRSADLSEQGEAYPLLLRAALDGWVRAWIGGPPCRTRSVLRHMEVPGEEMPRPLRSWGDGEQF
eukprot:s3094_g8.t1